MIDYPEYTEIDTPFEHVVGWLEEKDPNEIVDRNCFPRCSNCFFANYYSDRFHIDAEVGFSTVDVGGDEYWKIPSWCTGVISLMDSLHDAQEKHITAAWALEILNNLENKGA